MSTRALNHMAAAELPWAAFIDLAKSLGCIGVEFRNDLPGTLFDGTPPEQVGQAARAVGIRILALAEIKAFNDWSDTKRDEALALMQIARACGAEKISLIARNDAKGMGAAERKANLDTALRELKPLLEAHDLVGLIEPLGFETCALRDKGEAVAAIEAVGGGGRFCIVHDTFHHRAVGGGEIYPDHTGMVHISGVVVPGLKDSELRDNLRGLVDAEDRLGNIEQLAALRAAGYRGPVSFEPFAPEVVARTDPGSALAASFAFIEARLTEAMAEGQAT